MPADETRGFPIAASVAVRVRAASVAMLAAAGAFVVLFLLAARAYPGGTDWEPAARGHDFWLNYLCDLARAVTPGGRPNVLGSLLAQASMMALTLGLLPLWWLLALLFPSRPGLGSAVRALGAIAVVGTIAVVLLPSDRFGAWHAVAIMVAGPPGFAAALLAVSGLAREERVPRVAAGVGAAMLLVAMIDWVLYLGYLSGTAPAIVAVLEKVALILLLAWMVAVSVRVARRG